MKKVIAEHSSGETAILVGHGGALRPMILHAMAAPIESLQRLSTGNTGITTLRFSDPDNGRIIHLNDMCHLHHLDD
jgi:broad specificity phosphatase PhoE